MCQLLGMNANTPTDICFSFTGFHRRGGKTDHHSDGFGIAFYEDKGYRLFNDAKAAIHSQIAKFISEYPIKSCNVIAHIRKATQGEVKLVNCHPFVRELWGQYWIFAHNGDLGKKPFNPPIFYRPAGTTDSEYAFCALLDTLRVRFGEVAPPLEELYRAIREITTFLAQRGTFNFVLSNGQYLFAHCSTNLYYVIRQHPFTQAHLVDDEIDVDFSNLATPQDRVAVIATLPLTDNENWIQFNSGDLKVFQEGQCVIGNPFA